MGMVIVMRGISGAGKSTHAQALKAQALGGVVVSADDYFVQNGEYQFDSKKLSQAHRSCFRAFLRALGITRVTERQEPLVIVDNTNTTRAEIAPYVLAAESYDYRVELIRVTCPIEVAAVHNIHGVSAKDVQDQLARWEEPLPWWTERTVQGVA